MIIDNFTGKYRFLSNFSPSVITIDGWSWPTVEHVYQGYKTKNPLQREEIRLVATPGQAKRLGKNVTLRSNWDDLKVPIMAALCEMKFEIPELRVKLMATGTAELIEGNTWGDTFWGVCNGKGQNMLGKILMEIRGDNRFSWKSEARTDSHGNVVI